MTDFEYGLRDKRVWVAGHRGMVGSAIVRTLSSEPIAELITVTSSDVDLRRQEGVEQFVSNARPDVVILAAAKVGGIQANRSAQGEFLYDNLMIAANVLHSALTYRVERTVVLGSSCIYPRETPQPMAESALLSGPLEPTNEGYAISKIAALELAKMYRRQYELSAISLMPANLYGPNDNYDLQTSHVLPALIRKVHEAKVGGESSVSIWGSGKPRREFLHVDDLAEAVVFSLRFFDEEGHINVGTGSDVSIAHLAETIAVVVGWDGEFEFDSSMPDGTMRKLLDVSKLSDLGWIASIELSDGIGRTYRDYLATLG